MEEKLIGGFDKKSRFVCVNGGRKVTFAKGWGKYRRKFSKVYKDCELDKMDADISKYCSNGWEHYISPIKINW